MTNDEVIRMHMLSEKGLVVIRPSVMALPDEAFPTQTEEWLEF